MDGQKIAIQVKELEKAYKLYDKPSDRLKESLGLSRKKGYKEHYALKGVNLTIHQGETVGIIGTNGSGKSTILKIITGVLNPTGGTVKVNGRISALLELGAGFNMEYNGIENVYLNGTMIGFSEKEISDRLDDILSFADIGDYVYQPVKTYSSGMFVRLAFAVAINIDPEILIVDEALSVGDVFFQAKCYHKFEEFKSMGKTIVFVSHDLSSISKYCDRVVLLNQGVKLGEGTPKEMIDAYKQVLVGQYPVPENGHFHPEEESLLEEEKEEEKRALEQAGESDSQDSGVVKNPELLEYGTKAAVIKDYYITDQSGRKSSAIIKGQQCDIHMIVHFEEDIQEPIFAFTIKNIKGVEITGTNTMVEKAFLESVEKGVTKHITFSQKLSLQGGEYLLSLGVTGYENEDFKVYHRLYDVMDLTVISDKDTVGYFDTDSNIKVKDVQAQPKRAFVEPKRKEKEKDTASAELVTCQDKKKGEAMSDALKKSEPIHLKEEEVLNSLPDQIGKVKLNFERYSGSDLYSDGEIEDEIFSIVRDVSRVEYASVIEKKMSWPILYHLSPLRANIVDWLPIKPGDKVLEIGSGCGAITDKLSEKAGSVTCVELSAKRSRINAYRNHDRGNIEIHVGNFEDIEPVLPDDYDFIFLIGVFEYGQSYIHTQTPYEDFLKIIQKHKKDNGCIVMAIENKFGLKYWAGCSEDHLGTYFSGLEGYPEGGSARTFTRKGLEKLFRSCNITQYSFYYPYPDYKLPTVIYSDKRLPNPGELTDNIRNFDRDRLVLFNEKYVFDSIVRDGMFDVFSNSFLVLIGGETQTSYVKYSNDRAEKYALRTEIAETKNGRLVKKIPLNEQSKGHVKGMKRSCELLKARYEGSGLSINSCELSPEGYAEFPFEKGVTLEELLDDCLAKEDMEGFYRLFDRYYELISYGEDSCEGERAVTDYDLIFANILVEQDKWTVIDYEWTMKQKMPPSEIAFRAVYCYVLAEEKRNKLDWNVIMDKLNITPDLAEEYRLREAKFQKQVTGKRKSMGEIRAAIGTIPYPVEPKQLIEGHLKNVEEHRIQIYADKGYGFHEEESYYIEDVYTDEFHLEAEIPLAGDMKGIRIDPANCSCVLRILKLALDCDEIPLQKRYVEMNGRKLKTGAVIFETHDPNIHVKLSELPMTSQSILKIRLEISPVSVGLAEDIVDSAKKVL